MMSVKHPVMILAQGTHTAFSGSNFFLLVEVELSDVTVVVVCA